VGYGHSCYELLQRVGFIALLLCTKGYLFRNVSFLAITSRLSLNFNAVCVCMYPQLFWNVFKTFADIFRMLIRSNCVTSGGAFFNFCPLIFSHIRTLDWSDYLLHESNGYYEAWADSFGKGVLRLEMLHSKGVGGTRFVKMRYKGWMGGQNWRSLVLCTYWIVQRKTFGSWVP